jgi:hypothetical protein
MCKVIVIGPEKINLSELHAKLISADVKILIVDDIESCEIIMKKFMIPLSPVPIIEEPKQIFELSTRKKNWERKPY